MADTIFLCFGSPTECWNCGGHTHAAGGPFPGDRQYCSEECYVEATEYAKLQATALRRVFDICPECGYDNQEHDVVCTKA